MGRFQIGPGPRRVALPAGRGASRLRHTRSQLRRPGVSGFTAGRPDTGQDGIHALAPLGDRVIQTRIGDGHHGQPGFAATAAMADGKGFDEDRAFRTARLAIRVRLIGRLGPEIVRRLIKDARAENQASAGQSQQEDQREPCDPDATRPGRRARRFRRRLFRGRCRGCRCGFWRVIAARIRQGSLPSPRQTPGPNQLTQTTRLMVAATSRLSSRDQVATGSHHVAARRRFSCKRRRRGLTRPRFGQE
jgi:hypothetical protein